MTDKEKIKAEIKRRIVFQKECIKNSYRLTGKPEEEIILEYKQLLSFIDSLLEEPESEDFEEALANEWKGYNDRGAATFDALEDNTQELAFSKGFYRGAKWQEKKDQSTIKLAEKVSDAFIEK